MYPESWTAVPIPRDWNTKFDVLSAVGGIVKGAVSLPHDGGLHYCSQSASLLEALVPALVKVGKRLSDAEIAQFRGQKQLLSTGVRGKI